MKNIMLERMINLVGYDAMRCHEEDGYIVGSAGWKVVLPDQTYCAKADMIVKEIEHEKGIELIGAFIISERKKKNTFLFRNYALENFIYLCRSNFFAINKSNKNYIIQCHYCSKPISEGNLENLEKFILNSKFLNNNFKSFISETGYEWPISSSQLKEFLVENSLNWERDLEEYGIKPDDDLTSSIVMEEVANVGQKAATYCRKYPGHITF